MATASHYRHEGGITILRQTEKPTIIESALQKLLALLAVLGNRRVGVFAPRPEVQLHGAPRREGPR